MMLHIAVKLGLSYYGKNEGFGVFANRALPKIFESNSEKLREVEEPCQMRNFVFLQQAFFG
jgi:hypothetical protein